MKQVWNRWMELCRLASRLCGGGGSNRQQGRHRGLARVVVVVAVGCSYSAFTVVIGGAGASAGGLNVEEQAFAAGGRRAVRSCFCGFGSMSDDGSEFEFSGEFDGRFDIGEEPEFAKPQTEAPALLVVVGAGRGGGHTDELQALPGGGSELGSESGSESGGGAALELPENRLQALRRRRRRLHDREELAAGSLEAPSALVLEFFPALSAYLPKADGQLVVQHYMNAWLSNKQPGYEPQFDISYSRFFPHLLQHLPALVSELNLRSVQDARGVFFLEQEPGTNDFGQALAFGLSGRAPGALGLCRLDVALNGMGDHGVEHLTRSPTLANLVELNLSNNHLTSKGAMIVIDCFSSRGLERLNLRHNGIGLGGFWAFYEALRSGHLAFLYRLDLRDNQDDGASEHSRRGSGDSSSSSSSSGRRRSLEWLTHGEDCGALRKVAELLRQVAQTPVPLAPGSNPFTDVRPRRILMNSFVLPEAAVTAGVGLHRD